MRIRTVFEGRGRDPKFCFRYSSYIFPFDIIHIYIYIISLSPSHASRSINPFGDVYAISIELLIIIN